ncbi:MAG: GNAT family N-acetyltransferase [Nocardioidaceae bacterium]|nr:GNAT family N-acetyltransferase [Nocardioidaceae bacterium]
MPRLTPPDVRFHRSFLEAVAEFIAEGGEGPRFAGLGVLAAVGSFPGEVFTADELRQVSTFSAYVERLHEVGLPETSLPPGIVPSTTLWWAQGEEYLGRLSIRHRLTPWLLDFGGHIGYAVRPSARGRGHATAMLAAALPQVAAMGIDSVLVTCDATNLASRSVIEANGGVLEDQRAEKLRYWLATT